jgi:hypothetical protein
VPASLTGKIRRPYVKKQGRASRGRRVEENWVLFLFNEGRGAGARTTTCQLPAQRDASDLGLTAVGEEFGAGDEAGVIRRQEGDRLCNLIRIGNAADRYLGRHVIE